MKIEDFFPGLEQSEQITLIDRQGWCEAWLCEAWTAGKRETAAAFVVVYRSPLVKDTSAMFAPVAKVLLEADHMEVIRSGRHQDDSMMFGCAEALFVRLYKSGSDPRYTVRELRQMLEVI